MGKNELPILKYIRPNKETAEINEIEDKYESLEEDFDRLDELTKNELAKLYKDIKKFTEMVGSFKKNIRNRSDIPIDIMKEILATTVRIEKQAEGLLDKLKDFVEELKLSGIFIDGEFESMAGIKQKEKNKGKSQEKPKEEINHTPSEEDKINYTPSDDKA